MMLNTTLYRQLTNNALILRLRVAISSSLIPQSKRWFIGRIALQRSNLESLQCRSVIFQCHNYCTNHNRDLTTAEVKALIQSRSVCLIDVREPNELVDEGKIDGCINIPCK